jgi:hypothetical protein
MKPVKARRQETFIDEIVETLRCVPKARLRIVRDVVGALAEPSFSDRNGTKLKRVGRKSLLRTPFCGMWKDRANISNGRSYGMMLRYSLEHRGDRT